MAFWSIHYLLSVALWGLAGMECRAEGLMSLQLRQTFTVKANRHSRPGELNHFPTCAGSREALLTQGEHFQIAWKHGSMPRPPFGRLRPLSSPQPLPPAGRGAKQQQRPVHLLTRFLTIPAASILQADYSCYITEIISDRSRDLSSLKSILKCQTKLDVLHHTQYKSTTPKGGNLVIAIITGPDIRQSGLTHQPFQQRYEHISRKPAPWKCLNFLQQTRFSSRAAAFQV